MARSTKHGQPWNSSFHSWHAPVSTPIQGFTGAALPGGDPIIHTSKGIRKQHIVLAEAPGEAGPCQVTRESRSCFHDKRKPPLENNPSQGVFKPTAGECEQHTECRAEAADNGTQRWLLCCGVGRACPMLRGDTTPGRGCLHFMGSADPKGEHTNHVMGRGTTRRESHSGIGYGEGNHSPKSVSTQRKGRDPKGPSISPGGRVSQPKSGGGLQWGA